MRVAATGLTGAPYDRGRTHGMKRREAVRAHLEAWLASLAAPPVDDPVAYVRRMLAETGFRASVEVHALDLLREVEGVADGAGLPRDLMFALQLLDEEWAYRARLDGGPTPSKCSSLALVEGDSTWLAQNMDLGVYTDGHQTLLRIAAGGEAPAALVFSLQGLVGLMGVNAAGVGVCVNALPQLPSDLDGMPVAFVIRKLLQCATLEEAVALVTTVPHATNQHYLIAGPGAARSFEASAAGVIEYRPPAPDRLFHTNHPLAWGDEAAGRWENSIARLRSLEERLSNMPAALKPIQDALSAFDDPVHPVCRLRREGAGQIGFTTGSMITALQSRSHRQVSWVSAGPPVIGGFSPHVLSRS